ncbi:MAG TPA: hypothetical protein VF035_08420 [Longimicrobiales bacterium]
MEAPRVGRSVPPRVRQGIAVVIVAGAAFAVFTFAGGRAAPGPDGAQQDSIQAQVDSARAAADSVAAATRADSVAAARADSLAAAGAASGDPSSSDSAAGGAKQAAGVKYNAGEDPAFAARMGWPVKGPAALPGAILPNKRIVAYYGNPLSKRMGVLGEYEKSEMLRRLKSEVAAWNAADPSTPVVPALHLIAVVAAGEAGPSGKWRTIMRDTLVEQVYRYAQEAGAIMFIDIQVGHSDIRELLPKFEKFLTRPDVHLGVDPEFMMPDGIRPGAKIGSMSAADINYVSGYLADLVRKNNLPPKVLTIHRFTRNMVTNYKDIKLRPEVQIVMHMDGWGAPWLKRDSYRDYIVREPVQYTGFKLFYHNDTKKGDPIMKPADVLKLNPKPLYIQYQ